MSVFSSSFVVFFAQLQAAEAAVERMEDVGGLNWRADNACDGICTFFALCEVL